MVDLFIFDELPFCKIADGIIDLMNGRFLSHFIIRIMD